jgi:hypothetical protein
MQIFSCYHTLDPMAAMAISRVAQAYVAFTRRTFRGRPVAALDVPVARRLHQPGIKHFYT